ncbi:hypothetical protein N181_27090 [Sinorhizobium fredii USDA 205]|uniref:DUF945 domain-containing protein n=1 Tax=Rhizobium fredii TaxID=380 RepID=A0A844AG68_RHIFR|nr:hypothetical protein [Sinorhizobium fredii]KSV82905.1 hypothetical protein N181_27090 [Sinorhizobium fredii USDA 205]MQX11361.1 hypothetical protein [Sinorhizobium fredii]GEC34257.1 hypothetical protein EFR01_44280 [Sinorhizobium fredii]GLS10504.1 hypothetical protein GCM10007864_41350 [Sinorhizobium fredii]
MEQSGKETGKGRRRALWVAGAVTAIVAAGIVGGKIVLESKVNELIAGRGGKAGSVEVDHLGRIHLRDVTLPLADGSSARIAAIDGRPKILFLNGTFEVTGLDIEVPTAKISVPHASVEDANLDPATLTELLSSKSAAPLSKRIDRFAAKRVSAPEVALIQAVAGSEQKTVYKNINLTEIANGRVARYSADGASFEFAMDIPDGAGGTKQERMTGSIGAMTGQDFDAAYMARLYTEKAGPDDKEARPLYGPLSAKAIAFSNGEARFAYDEMRSSGFSMRMPSEPLLETLEKLTSVANPEELGPEERRAFFARLLSLADMIGKGDMEMLGLKIDAPAKNGEAEGDKIKLAVDRMAFQLDGRTLDAALNGLSMGAGGDYVKFSEASITGFSWNSTLEAMKTMAGLDEQQLETFPFTTLLPEFGTFRVAGIDVDLPNPETGADSADAGGYADETDETDALAAEGLMPDAEQTDETDQQAVTSAEKSAATAVPERIRFTLKNYELALTKPFHGIPTDIRFSYEDLSVPVPADAQDETSVQLRKLGFEELVVSSNIQAAWDEPNQTLAIKDISVSGKDVGGLSLSGLMGGFTKDFFSGDTAMAQVALLGLTAREMNLKIEDKGGMAKGIKFYADQNGMTEDQARGMLTMMAAAVLQQFAADQPKLQGPVDALSRFIAKPGTFTLAVRSKAETGIGAFDLIAASENPVLLLDKVDLEATAQ